MRVALSFVGVCGTDLQILNGRRPDTAEILGHEGVGTIVEASGRGDLAVGEQVVFNPVAQLSRGWILGHNTPGLFQKYITLDAQAVDEGLVMPANECDQSLCGPLVEPLAAIVYGHELISNKVPELRTIAIFGAGPVGLLAVIYLRSLGVRVLLVHPTRTRLDTVASQRNLNPDAIFVASDDVAERIKACGGSPIDAALICTTRAGAPSALRQAVEIVRDGGCIDLVTNYPEEAGTPLDVDVSTLRCVRAENVCGSPKQGRYLHVRVSGRQIAFTGHRGTSHSHLRTALRSLASNAASYTPLVTHVLPLREAAETIQHLSESNHRFVQGRDCVKLVIDMESSLTNDSRVPVHHG